LHESYTIVWDELEIRLGGNMPDPDSDREKNYQYQLHFLKDTVQSIVHKRRELKNQEKICFLDHLTDHKFSDDYIRDEIITFFVGGFHTSGNLFTWLMYYISAHENVQSRLQEEVSKIDIEKMTPNQIITSLIYCRAVIKETLRLSNLAPWAARYPSSNMNIGKYQVSANTPIIQALGYTSVDPKNGWKDPETFNPDRFLEANNNKFVPFGYAGSRVCPGMNYSYYFSTLLIYHLITNFNLKLETTEPVGKSYSLVTKPDKPIYVSFIPR